MFRGGKSQGNVNAKTRVHKKINSGTRRGPRGAKTTVTRAVRSPTVRFRREGGAGESGTVRRLRFVDRGRGAVCVFADRTRPSPRYPKRAAASRRRNAVRTRLVRVTGDRGYRRRTRRSRRRPRRNTGKQIEMKSAKKKTTNKQHPTL